MKKLFLLGALALAPILVQAQYSNFPAVVPFAGAPSGSCGPTQLAVNMSSGALSTCLSGSWSAVSANPFASGGTTNNVIPKSNGSSQLADSSITDNGTNVTTAEPLNLTTLSTTASAVQGNSASTYGLFFGSSSIIGLGVNTNSAWIATSSTSQTTLEVPTGGGIGFSSSNTFAGAASDTLSTRRAAAGWQFGAADAASPVIQTLSFQGSRGGTDTNVAGTLSGIQSSLGTGNAVGAGVAIKRPIMQASGTTQQTALAAFAVGQSKTLSNTSATAQAIATITLGSNAGGGAAGTFTLVCTDGTNFDSETQSFTVSYVNKAAAVTVGTPAITTSTAANNSGSCTLGITAVANGNNIDIKVTPVFTTIVPTTVTIYPIITHTTNTVAFD